MTRHYSTIPSFHIPPPAIPYPQISEPLHSINWLLLVCHDRPMRTKISLCFGILSRSLPSTPPPSNALSTNQWTTPLYKLAPSCVPRQTNVNQNLPFFRVSESCLQTYSSITWIFIGPLAYIQASSWIRTHDVSVRMAEDLRQRSHCDRLSCWPRRAPPPHHAQAATVYWQRRFVYGRDVCPASSNSLRK
jgi:hypothetical protein